MFCRGWGSGGLLWRPHLGPSAPLCLDLSPLEQGQIPPGGLPTPWGLQPEGCCLSSQPPLHRARGGHRNGTGGRVCSSSLNLIKSHESRISQTRKPSCEGRCPRPRWEAVPLDWPHAGDWAAPALAPVPPWAPATLSLGSDPLHEDGEALLAHWVAGGSESCTAWALSPSVPPPPIFPRGAPALG